MLIVRVFIWLFIVVSVIVLPSIFQMLGVNVPMIFDMSVDDVVSFSFWEIWLGSTVAILMFFSPKHSWPHWLYWPHASLGAIALGSVLLAMWTLLVIFGKGHMILPFLKWSGGITWIIGIKCSLLWFIDQEPNRVLRW